MRVRRRWAGLLALAAALGCHSSPFVPLTPAGAGPSGGPVVTQSKPTWLAFGDSLTQDAFAVNLAWKEVLGPEGPAPINAGVRGDMAGAALARPDRLLAAHPEARYVGVAFGTNDASGRVPLDAFQAQLQALVERIRKSGKQAVLATVPYSPDSDLGRLPEYNRVIKAVEAANGLPPGPDLYALVEAHPEYLAPDGVHMTPQGNQALQRAWAEVAARLDW